MSLPGVSIIMTPKDRTRLLERTLDTIWAQSYPDLEIIVVEDRPSEGSLQALCHRNKIKYDCRKSPVEGWMNPAPLLNRGLLMSEKELVIFQNAEVRHDTPTLIEDLVAPIMSARESGGPTTSTVACVRSLNQHGEFEEWYTHPKEGNRAMWISPFCQMVPRTMAMRIQGFEETFTKYGWEDNLWEYMLKMNGVRLFFVTEAIASHQWHPRFTGDENNGGKEHFQAICREIEVGARPAIANLMRPWGRI